MADHDRLYRSLLDLVEETGQVQAAQEAAKKGGKVPTEGFWRVEPPVFERANGSTIMIYTPRGGVVKSRIPKNGCSGETVRILRNSLQGHGFDEAGARAAQTERLRTASQQQSAAVAAQENARHEKARASRKAKSKNPDEMPKKWPKEEIVDCDVSPGLAVELLKDPGNGKRKPRPISRKNVDHFKRIINEGRWDADYMHIDFYGQVINGRHRLTAIAEGDKTVTCKIIYGVHPDKFRVMDTAYRRTGGHTLFTEGLADEKDERRIAAALKLLDDIITGKPMESWGNARVDNDMIVGLALKYPDINLAMTRAHVLHSGRRDGVARFMPAPAIVFCYLVARSWPGCGETLDEFIMGVTRAEGMPGSDPRMRLHKVMMGEQAKSDRALQLMLLLKIWNYFCKGIPLNKAASWRASEGLPTPVTEKEVILKF